MASKSRPTRWAEASARAVAAKDELVNALEELKGVQEEYNDWYESMPESLKQGPTGEKLDAIQNLDLDIDLDVIDEADGIDLPLGFGRD